MILIFVVPLSVQVHKVEPFLSALYEHAIPEVGSMEQQCPKITILPRGSLSQVWTTVCVRACVRACMRVRVCVFQICT